jgi:hypothetical protein
MNTSISGCIKYKNIPITIKGIQGIKKQNAMVVATVLMIKYSLFEISNFFLSFIFKYKSK